MKYFIFVALLLLCITGKGQVLYISAAPYSVEVTQPDGSKLKVLGMGDELNHFSVTEDGFTVLKNQKGFFEFARLNETGKLVPSGIRAKSNDSRTDAENQFLNSIPKYLKDLQSEMQEKHNVEADESQKVFPSSGSQKMLMLLIK